MDAKKKDVEVLKKWAVDNYEKGGDTFVECWEDSDYAAILEDEGSLEGALKMLKDVASVYLDRQMDAKQDRDEARRGY